MLRESIMVEVERDLADLVPIFLEQRCKDQMTMERALHTGDFEAMRIIGHGMAGSGRGYGFNEITEIGEAIEQAARVQNVTELTQLAARLTDYMARVVVQYV